MIPGSVNVDEMMTRLLRIVDFFKKRQRLERAEEGKRTKRVLREQDEAYQLSLQIDRLAVFRQKFVLSHSFIRKHLEPKNKWNDDDEMKQKEMRRQNVLKRLPAEPPINV